jgi:hypothetical protein
LSLLVEVSNLARAYTPSVLIRARTALTQLAWAARSSKCAHVHRHMCTTCYPSCVPPVTLHVYHLLPFMCATCFPLCVPPVSPHVYHLFPCDPFYSRPSDDCTDSRTHWRHDSTRDYAHVRTHIPGRTNSREHTNTHEHTRASTQARTTHKRTHASTEYVFACTHANIPAKRIGGAAGPG